MHNGFWGVRPIAGNPLTVLVEKNVGVSFARV
jgi:hypothetical protein